MRFYYLLLLWLFLPGLLLSAEGQTADRGSPRGLSGEGTADVAADIFPSHIDTALSYFGAKELKKENHGPDVRKFLASVGLGEGYPYCAAFNSYCLDAGGATYPRVRSALAQDFITNRSVDAKKVLRGQRSIPSGWIHVMKKGNTRSGHTGFVLLPWSGRSGIVIDANTGLGFENSSERDGQGVWIRKRTIYTTCYFCVDSFTPVEYD